MGVQWSFLEPLHPEEEEHHMRLEGQQLQVVQQLGDMHQVVGVRKKWVQQQR